jgi:arginine N-succinyltransferase
VSNRQSRVRPARPSDLDAFMRLARAVGDGMTNMPADEAVLHQRLAASEARLASGADEILPDGIWLVLEIDGEVCGSSAIFPSIGLDWPFYSFKKNRLTNRSLALGKSVTVETLNMNNDLCGMAEVGGLVMHPDARQGGAGRVAAQARYLFMAAHRSWFPDKVIAEMRGYLDEHGRSPVWEALGRPFYGMEFPDADKFGAINGNQFIAELGPRHVIYVDMLPEEVRASIGKAHVESAIALRMLWQEGFEDHGYCDIFDGGPQVIAQIDRLRLLKDQRKAVVRKVTPNIPSGQVFLISIGRQLEFCVTKGIASVDQHEIDVEEDAAHALGLIPGDEVNVVAA